MYGDGLELTDSTGTVLFKFSELFNILSSTEDGKLGEALKNVLLPFLTEGVLTGNYDHYFAALEKEVGELFESVRLDNNGDVCTDSGIPPQKKEEMTTAAQQNLVKPGGYYWWGYEFYYDWRLDPYESADQLNEYIRQIIKTTGVPKVNLNIYCLGSNVLLAYVDKYGTKDIHAVGIDGSVSGGAEIITDPLCGRFELDSAAIDRFLTDLKAMGNVSIDDFAQSSIDLLLKTGVLDSITEIFRKTVYDKIIQGVTSALALSTFFTWPNYWASISAEDYETCKKYVFGDSGSEKRLQYAGLIEKTDHYHKSVRMKIPELLRQIKDECANLVIISKYGFQIAPICESHDVVSDQYISVGRSSFGATTGDIFSTFSDKYIEESIRQGRDAYISPDKQIDASTCLFPDNTWFIKGSSHSHWSKYEWQLLYDLTSGDTAKDVNSFAEYPQFAVWDPDTDMAVKMTEENCDTYHWTTEKETKHGLFYRFMNFYRLLFEWIKNFFKRL